MTNRNAILIASVCGLALLFFLSGKGTSSAVSNPPTATAKVQTLAEPTSTRTPAPPTPAINLAGELSYVSAINDETKDMGSSLTDFLTLANAPKVTDPTWKRNVTVACATWQVTYEAAGRLTVPVRFQTFHTKYLQSLKQYYDAADLIVVGIAQGNADSLTKANVKMGEGYRLLNEALPLFKQLTAN